MAEKYKKTKQRDEQYCQHIVTVQLKQCDRLLKDALEKQSDEHSWTASETNKEIGQQGALVFLLSWPIFQKKSFFKIIVFEVKQTKKNIHKFYHPTSLYMYCIWMFAMLKD